LSFISDYIENKTSSGEKILSVFLTSGFPDQNNFVDLALKVLDAGADMLEIGFPFSDPLADGPTIQYSSQMVLEKGMNIEKTFNYLKEIRSRTDKPLILMGYANPVLRYGTKKFANDAKESGANGVIIPDVPIDEYEKFFHNYFDDLDIILLATPTTNEARLKKIDELSKGFVYYVSMTGTTGSQVAHDEKIIAPLKKAASIIKKNQMLVGFGISTPDDVKIMSKYGSGVIVGSAIIKSLMNNQDYSATLELVQNLKSATLPSRSYSQ
jgi:tryptophan synthase alpha chain